MIYEFNKNNYKKFEIFEDNKLPARSYFIPFSCETYANAASITRRRYVSDKVLCLSGEWDFKYFKRFKDVPKQFDSNSIAFDRVPVPSCWQSLGYEPPFYTNVKYPFPVRPPHIPTTFSAGKYGPNINGIEYACGEKQFNSVGVYRKFFEVKNLEKTRILSLLGVCSCGEVYLNGKYVGYSEGSHNTAEFDISKYLILGQNELLIVVHKWCNGSYLEDQDMLRYNGIFRDVLIYVYDKSFIWDVQFSSKKNGVYHNAFVNVNVIEPEEGESIKVKLSYGEELLAEDAKPVEKQVKFIIPELLVKPWNAEVPTLYNLTILLEKDGEVVECIRKDVGFASSRVSGKYYVFNDKAIKLKGVNHHDDYPSTGYAMSPELMDYDVRLMKLYNVNTVRTSHYPPDPMFIELCDYYGIYVVDEADIETHGTKTPLQISNKLKWKNHFWDRVSRMFYRDRNSCSVIMWSLGNESGGIKCHDYCYDMLKKLSPLPVHYCEAFGFPRAAYDVVSRMYPTLDFMKELLEGTKKRMFGRDAIIASKPFFMCEYAHAMGTAPGNLEEYWNMIYSHPNAMGGCIWEFADHVAYNGENAKYKFTYGGDHGEYTHDGNFCCDGLFYGNRYPHPAAYDMKNVYRPIRAKLLSETGLIEFTNLNAFRIADYVKVKGRVYQFGEKISSFEFFLNTKPGEKERFDMHLVDVKGDVTIHIDYYEGENLIATEELRPSAALVQVDVVPGGTLRITDDNNGILRVDFNGGFVKFDTANGILTDYVYRDEDLFVHRPTKAFPKGIMYTNIFRAPIDNDVEYKKGWEKFGYDNISFKLHGFKYESKPKEVRVYVEHFLCGTKGRELFVSKDIYAINADGSMNVCNAVVPVVKGLPTLPSIGKVLEFSDEFTNIVYYGMGNIECYSDHKSQARLGVYSGKTNNMTVPNMRPQFSGNHMDCRYVAIRNDAGKGALILADTRPFNFSVKKMSEANLAKATHQEDLVDEGINYVRIDGFMSGVGNRSCGPRTLDKYLLPAEKDKKYVYTFRIIPFSAVKDQNIIASPDEE